MVSWILKGLPLNISITGKIPNENITIKFSHDSIKNFFLIKQIEQELYENKFETISLKSIVNDTSLI